MNLKEFKEASDQVKRWVTKHLAEMIGNTVRANISIRLHGGEGRIHDLLKLTEFIPSIISPLIQSKCIGERNVFFAHSSLYFQLISK